MGEEKSDSEQGGAANFRDPLPFSLTAGEHSVEVIAGGGDRLLALIALIEAAQRSLSLSFYIFEDDTAGKRVIDALGEAAARGVDVRLIVDGFGTSGDDRRFKRLRRAGGRVWLFSPRWSRRFLIRNHQKFAIADETRALVGGFNVSDEYFASPKDNGWCDLGVVIEGPVVGRLVEWFEQLARWVDSPRSQWFAIRRAVRDWTPRAGNVQLLIGGPTARLSSWARAVGADIDNGQRFDSIMAYFSPSNAILRRIAALARRGSAKLVMAGKSDNGATIGATRSLYNYLLARGVEVYEFAPCKLHAKLIVVDDVTYIGSANFDMRSLFLNLELMLRIEDAELAEKMRAHIAHHRAASKPITLEAHRAKATLLNRIRWNLSWFLVSAVDYTVTRRLNLGQ